MLLLNNEMTNLSARERFIKYDNYTVYWKGFIYIPFTHSGDASIKKFIKKIKEMGIQEAIQLLHGNFFVTVIDHRMNKTYSFIDNSGLFEAYYDNYLISTSFLEIVKESKFNTKDLDKRRIIEFLNAGVLYNKRTFFEEVKKIDRLEILVSHENQRSLHYKVERDLEPLEEEFFVDFFAGFAKSVENQSVSVDLTGGIDSRLLATILDANDVKFECSVSGSNKDKDVAIAEEVAHKLNHSLIVSERPSTIEEKEMEQLFYFCDGLYEIFNAYSGRNSQLQRSNREVDLIITGAGGELFKDFFWLQDFPQYRKSTSDIGKLFHTRISPIKFDTNLLSEPYAPINMNYSENAINELSKYEKNINTKTYDQIYYFYRMQALAGRLLTSSSSIVNSYSPLLEYNLVRVGYNLPRMKRFFNNFHREIITKLNPTIAKTQTTEGKLTVSSEKLELMKDTSKYVSDKGVRLAKKVVQRILKKTLFSTRYHHESFYQSVRALPIATETFEILIKENIIKKNKTLAEVRDEHLGRIISLGLLIKYLETSN